MGVQEAPRAVAAGIRHRLGEETGRTNVMALWTVGWEG